MKSIYTHEIHILYCIHTDLIKVCKSNVHHNIINMNHSKSIILLLGTSLLALTSCFNSMESPVMYNLDVNTIDYKQKPIEDWYVCGAFNPKNEIIGIESFEGDISELEEIENPDSLNPYWYNGHYKPMYNMLDLKEIFNIKPGPKAKSFEDKITFLACDIQSNKESDLFMKVKKSMKCYQYMNGEMLHRREIQGLNFYPIHLNKGYNRYLIKAIAKTNDYSFESTILDGKSVASIYTNGQSNNIVLPEISPETNIISFTNNHYRVFNTPVKIQIHDVRGKKVHEVTVDKDTITVQIPSLEKDMSYMCTMMINGQSVRQPIVYGSFDQTYEKLIAKRKSVPDSMTRTKEIDQILYRLGFLLNHESRENDWWWQFKIAPLTYQLEVLFANPNGEHGKDKGEFNIQFVTYTSELDDGIQRYLLATPNKMEKGKKYPLVVVIRPHVENHHHFFTSPQFSHQWAINIIQSLANSHDFIVMMPEARMHHNENITPFIETEMKLAIEDVKKHYNIDEDRIYLHGICSGGYRALRMATENPNMFAAIGLYAQMYHEKFNSEYSKKHSLESMLPNLAGMPIMLFADPFDKHTPYQVYGDLINDCHKYNIPLTFSQKINTELLYNAVVVGEEAFDFFDGKNRRGRCTINYDKGNEKVVADLYSKPFVYVYNASNKSYYYRNLTTMLKMDYKEYLFTDLPLVADVDVDENMMKTKNLFLIGDTFDNDLLTDAIKKIEADSPDLFEFGINSLSIHDNPLSNDKSIVIYCSYASDDSYFKYPWIDGTKASFKSDEQ